MFMSNRPEFRLQNRAREAYYALFSYIAQQSGLELNRHSYRKVVLKEPRFLEFLRGHKIVAVIESDSPIAELDDLSNEGVVTDSGDECFVDRRYDGLEIEVINPAYAKQLEEVGDLMSAMLQERVVVRKAKSPEKSLHELEFSPIVVS